MQEHDGAAPTQAYPPLRVNIYPPAAIIAKQVSPTGGSYNFYGKTLLLLFKRWDKHIKPHINPGLTNSVLPQTSYAKKRPRGILSTHARALPMHMPASWFWQTYFQDSCSQQSKVHHRMFYILYMLK
jgi:hypothetical protein